MPFNEHRDWTENVGQEAGGDVIVVAAGDIGDEGGRMQETAGKIAEVLQSAPRAIVLALGDNAYDSGTRDELNTHYKPSWGRFEQNTWTCPGNHDYRSSDALPFYAFFGDRAGPDKRGYYSLNAGPWHMVALNSEIARNQQSDQIGWLKNDLLRNKDKPILALFHKPRFSSGTHGSDETQIAFWHALFQRNAEIILNGHDHHYERFDPQDPESNFVTRGIREFLVGTGGKSLRRSSKREKHSVVRHFDAHGVLRLTLRRDSYDWEFLSIGQTFVDASQQPVPINVHFQ